MAGEIKNCFLINAPAGSGKTTQIKAMVQQFSNMSPNANILCITYTRRAAEELSKDINTKNIFIGTIHAFLHNFMKPYFVHSSVIDLYFEVYGAQIRQRIENPDKKEHITESNNRYIEKHGCLDFETVRKNVLSISYNESPFSSLYNGGLSHDDLISFTKQVFDRYPILKKRISHKYQFIFIDEYQDTMADVLKIFYESIDGSDSKLYLFGDRMQQIYNNYDGSFENQFEQFDSTIALTTNYRSVPIIVDILNKIYNDASFAQDTSLKMSEVESDFLPKVIISSDPANKLDELKQSNPDALILYLFNKNRFSDIGASALYEAYSKMEKYSFGRTYSPVDILTTRFEDNPDALIKLLYCIVTMADHYKAQRYGTIVQSLRSNPSMFCKESWYVKTHNDKLELFNRLGVIFSVLEHPATPIIDLFNAIKASSLVEPSYIDGIEADEGYSSVLLISVIELLCITNYLKNPRVSTQHGVKGESHDSVIFVADDSTRSPIVHMYRFLEMWGLVPVSLKEFNQFYYSYIAELAKLQGEIGVKMSDLIQATYSQHKDTIVKYANAIVKKFEGNPYFDFLCKEDYIQFLKKPGQTQAKGCLKESSVFGALCAYKLFYVGCSRARRNLTVLIDQAKLKGDSTLLVQRLKKVGFEVE